MQISYILFTNKHTSTCFYFIGKCKCKNSFWNALAIYFYSHLPPCLKKIYWTIHMTFLVLYIKRGRFEEQMLHSGCHSEIYIFITAFWLFWNSVLMGSPVLCGTHWSHSLCIDLFGCISTNQIAAVRGSVAKNAASITCCY